MSNRISDEEIVYSVMNFLKGMWFVFAQMASLLERFSMRVAGQLSFHASLASNRLSLLARNLEDGLAYLEADFLDVSSLEELKSECGSYVVDAVMRLAESLSILEKRYKAADKLNVKAELEKFESLIKVAAGAFSKMRQEILETDYEKGELLGILLEDLVDDLRIIGERIREAKSIVD